jgi:hypothetical protein
MNINLFLTVLESGKSIVNALAGFFLVRDALSALKTVPYSCALTGQKPKVKVVRMLLLSTPFTRLLIPHLELITF